MTNLNKWSLSIQDWQLVNVLDIVLLPFLKATQIISGQNYPTLPISHVVYCSLKRHLNNKSQLKEEETLKQILLEKLEYHFNTKLSQKQLNITLVKFTFYLKIKYAPSCTRRYNFSEKTFCEDSKENFKFFSLNFF